MKCLVLLAGCGLGDGSCIEEVILTYAALDKYGCDYTPVAEALSVQSVNHLTEQLAEKRNILLEAARIGRGRIEDIREIEFDKYNALIKPIATMCAGIDFLRSFWEGSLLASEAKELSAEEFCFDADNNIYYTPAFRKTGSCYTALSGIDSMIYALSQAQATF